MIKQLLLSGMALFAAFSTLGSNVVKLSDVDFKVDTLFHAKVGPGTTQTSLLLTNTENTSQNLRVFYLTVDLTNPIVSIKSVIAQDKLPGGGTVKSMAESHSTETETFYAGVNTDFFNTSGNASNGTSIVGAPVRAAMAGGEIYRTYAASSAWPNFYVDADGNPGIGAVSFAGGTAEANGATVAFSVVNEDAAANNAVSVYTPKYYGVMNQPHLAGSCAEVSAKIVEGEFIAVGKPVKVEVTSEPSSTGNLAVPADGCVLAGRGTAIEFINGLKVGDVVTLNASATVGGTPIVPVSLCTANPNILENGVTLESEGDRGDASARHPRTSIGYTNDKSKMVMMVIDGRSSLSIGVHTMELADMMRYAGADNAVNVDGGGSSTLYTLPLGVRNRTSDGSERAVASGMFCVASAPNDDVITEIRFVDWAMQFPKYGIYTPKFYGYNQYGMLVDTDLEGVTLSCDSKIGEVINDGTTFYGTGDGTAALTATYGNLTASIPVTVAPSDNVALRLENVLIDNKREYAVEVQAIVNESFMPVNSAALAWESSAPDVASVDAAMGVIKGLENGSAVVTGTVGDFTGQINVTVEIPEGETMPIIREFDADAWRLGQSGGSGLAMAEYEKGFKLNYTGNGVSRGAYISVESPVYVWSLPESFAVSINPGNASVKKISMNAENALGETVSTWLPDVLTYPSNEDTRMIFSISDWCDTEDIGIYPIKITSFRLDMGKSDSGEEFEIKVPEFVAVYSKGGSVAENVAASTFRLFPNPVDAGVPVSIKTGESASVSVYSLNGAKVADYYGNGEIEVSTSGLKGMYLVSVATQTSRKVAKMVVK